MAQLTEQGWANFFKYYADEKQQTTAVEILRKAIYEADPEILDDNDINNSMQTMIACCWQTLRLSGDML